MMGRVAAVWILGMSFVCVGICESQEGAAPVVAAGRITLDVVVTTKSGGAVAGLGQADFTVLDNKEPRPITSFAAEGGHEAPVKVVLVVDAVNADYRTVGLARQEIDKFLLADRGELAYTTKLAILTDKGVQMQSGGSRDGKELSTSLDQQTVALRSIQRSAGFYGAQERLDISLRALGQLAAREAAEPGRKIVLWVSPGWPLLSGPRVQLDSKEEAQIFQRITAFSTELRKARITLYSVDPLGSGEGVGRTHYYETFLKGVSKPSQVQVGDLGLQVLARQSGGQALASSNDVAGLLKQAMEDTEAYYEISIDAAPGDKVGEYHQIEVKVGKPGLVARTRMGYYPAL